MPVIKSAIKKARRDKKRQKANDAIRRQVESAIKLTKKQKTPKNISHAFSLIDRAVKKNLMHKNRAARIKSSLSRVAKSGTPTVSKKPASKTPAKKGKSKVIKPKK